MHCNVATRSAIELSDTNDAYNTVVWCEYVGVVIRYDVRVQVHDNVCAREHER